MEIMYWTFPHVSGKWGVSRNGSHQLAQGSGPDAVLYLVKRWEDGCPIVGGVTLDDAFDEFKGTRWVEGPAVQQGDTSAWSTQVGGSHYTDMRIQPFRYSMENKLDPMQHTIVKYVSRFRDKNGLQDLEKAKQTIDLLIEWEKEHGAT